MQPSARCLTPWLRWTTALFAALGRYRPPRRGRVGLDFEGASPRYSLVQVPTVHCGGIRWSDAALPLLRILPPRIFWKQLSVRT
jgi:hypothetical protein